MWSIYSTCSPFHNWEQLKLQRKQTPQTDADISKRAKGAWIRGFQKQNGLLYKKLYLLWKQKANKYFGGGWTCRALLKTLNKLWSTGNSWLPRHLRKTSHIQIFPFISLRTTHCRQLKRLIWARKIRTHCENNTSIISNRGHYTYRNRNLHKSKRTCHIFQIHIGKL